MTPADRSAGGRGVTQWQRPRTETGGIQRYVEILRERIGTIVIAVAITTLAALCYLAVATKTYEAEADLLVTPISGDEPALSGLGLIVESNDPTRDVETASRLIVSRDVANRVRKELNIAKPARDLLKQVKAEPVAQSNVVAVTAEADSPRLARDIANGFAEQVVAKRDASLRTQIDKVIPTLRQRIEDGETSGTGGESLDAQLAVLESLRASGDPTIRVETGAEVPPDAASPKPKLTVLAAILGGLVIGVGGAFVLHSVDPRLRRESQLRELYSLPILGRIPKEQRAETETKGERRFGIGPRKKHRAALGPGELSPRTSEAYRTLRSMLAATRPSEGHGRSILVTGPSPSEGKTTTAINLASSLALAGNRVIVIEADFRRPTVGQAFGVKPRVGIGKVLLRNVSLEDALVPTPVFGDSLRVLLVDHSDDWLAEVLALPSSRSLLEDARELADFVIVDSPPLTEVIDALPLARQVDDVLLVTRLGSSNLSQLARLGDVLAQNDITPAGFVIVGVGSSEEETYYLSARRERGLVQQPGTSNGEASPSERVRSTRS